MGADAHDDRRNLDAYRQRRVAPPRRPQLRLSAVGAVLPSERGAGPPLLRLPARQAQRCAVGHRHMEGQRGARPHRRHRGLAAALQPVTRRARRCRFRTSVRFHPPPFRRPPPRQRHDRPLLQRREGRARARVPRDLRSGGRVLDGAGQPTPRGPLGLGDRRLNPSRALARAGQPLLHELPE